MSTCWTVPRCSISNPMCPPSMRARLRVSGGSPAASIAFTRRVRTTVSAEIAQPQASAATWRGVPRDWLLNDPRDAAAKDAFDHQQHRSRGSKQDERERHGDAQIQLEAELDR